MSIGTELRRRRTEMGLTLRELAEASDLTSGFLSQVENDRVSPSLKSLGRVAEVLRVPLFQLLSDPDHDPVVRGADRPTIKWPDGSDITVELLTPRRDWQLLPFQRVMKPNERLEAIKLEHAREEWILVQSGEIEVVLSDDEHHGLAAGDAIHFESSRLQEIVNPTAEPATYICMMTPPPF